MKHHFLLLGLLLVATNAGGAAAADNENHKTRMTERLEERRLHSKPRKNSSNSSSSSSSKGSKYSKGSSSKSSKSSPSSSDNISCTPSEQSKCCTNGNRALCIIDNGCNIDNCGRCEKELFKQCCLESGDALVYCVTDLNCDVTKCGGEKKKKKETRMLLVESGKPKGEGNAKIFQ